MISLRDGNRLIPFGGDNSSVEVGAVDQLVTTLETLREAVIAGELDAPLETLISSRKLFGKKKQKSNPTKAG